MDTLNMPEPAAIAVAVVSVLSSLYLVQRWRESRKLPLPPGPPKWPLIGSALSLPTENEHKVFKAWGKEYGPLIHVDALGTSIVILNSHEVATNLLEKKGRIYAGRPVPPMFGVLVGWSRSMGLMNGDPFVESRKLAHRAVEGSNAYKFRDCIESETQKFILRIRDDPKEFRQHVRVTAASIIFLITHGYPVDPRPYKDPFVTLYQRVMSDLSNAFVPGRWWIDIVPILRFVPSWFPGGGFKRTAKEFRDRLDQSVDLPHEWTIKQLQAGTGVPSVTQQLVEESEGPLTEKKETLIKWLTGALLAGGTDTTVSLTSTFFLAMSLHPRFAKQAQKELDEIVGPDRLPNLSDRPKLPMLEAILCEIMRYAPPSVVGAPHCSTEEDVYMGYRIPKGSLMWSNLWGMTHDESIPRFKNSSEFNPMRYLDANGKFDSGIRGPNHNDPREIIFGFGRRICPGSEIAQLNVWTTMALTLHLFDITKPGASGTVMSDQMYYSAMLTHPAEFPCNITPRSENAKRLMQGLEHIHGSPMKPAAA